MRKKSDFTIKRLTSIKAFELGDIILKDDFFLNVTQKDVDFINTFDVSSPYVFASSTGESFITTFNFKKTTS